MISAFCERREGGRDMRTKQAAPEGDVRSAAQNLVARLPLREIFQNRELADAFLSELMLALARESSRENRRERQREGIAQAKARGVRFGKPSRSLPENFEDMRQAWRSGWCSLRDAAEACGMPESSFYTAAQRAEKAAQETAEKNSADHIPSGAAVKVHAPARERADESATA